MKPLTYYLASFLNNCLAKNYTLLDLLVFVILNSYTSLLVFLLGWTIWVFFIKYPIELWYEKMIAPHESDKVEG